MLIEKHTNCNLSNYREHEKNIFHEYVGLMSDMDRPELIISHFTRFVRTQEITRLLLMYELFNKIKEVHGSIIEVGVLEGFNVFAMAHFSEILEHRNYSRRIFGFDTFSGYLTTDPEKDRVSLDEKSINFPMTYSYEQLQRAVDLFNRSIAFNQFEKISLVQGDATVTIPAFAADHPELVVSMLICHCDVYAPTVTALKHFYPRMPKGGVVFLGTLNYEPTPGETVALKEAVGIDGISLKRFPFSTKGSYFVKE